MVSHKVLKAGTTTTFPISATGEYVRFQSITVCGADAAAIVTMTVTRAGIAYSAVFNAVTGWYCGPFQFDPLDAVVFVVAANTTVLLEGFILADY